MSKKKKKKEASYHPETDTGKQRPVRAVVAVGDIYDKYSTHPSNGLTPRRLAQIFREAEEGDVMRQMELFEEMEEKDPHLFAQLQTRKLAVTGLDWTIQPAGKSEFDKQVADFVEDQLKQIPKLQEVMLDILDAIGKGISVSEIEWDVDASGHNVITGIEWVHPKKLFWDYETDEMKICTREFPEGISLPENKFIVYRYKAKSGHPSRAGILRILAWMYLFKNYTLKDWVAFCEVYGMPLRLGKYNQAASEDDKAMLAEAIINLGTDAAGIIPDTAQIEFIESNKVSSAEIYERLSRYCDEQISKAILGQTLTSDSGGGSYAQGKVHAEVRHDLTLADAGSLDETIRECIIRPLVLFNFGPDVACPIIQHDCKDPEDLKDTVEIYKTLVCEMGLPIPEQHVYKKFSIPKPEDGEAVLDPFRGRQNGSLMSAKLKQPLSIVTGKDGGETVEPQQPVDAIAEQAVSYSADLFPKLFQPVLDLVADTDDLKELKKRLSDPEELEKLYDRMGNSEFEDLIAQAVYMAELIGRSAE